MKYWRCSIYLSKSFKSVTKWRSIIFKQIMLSLPISLWTSKVGFVYKLWFLDAALDELVLANSLRPSTSINAHTSNILVQWQSQTYKYQRKKRIKTHSLWGLISVWRFSFNIVNVGVLSHQAFSSSFRTFSSTNQSYHVIFFFSGKHYLT